MSDTPSIESARDQIRDSRGGAGTYQSFPVTLACGSTATPVIPRAELLAWLEGEINSFGAPSTGPHSVGGIIALHAVKTYIETTWPLPDGPTNKENTDNA